MTADFVVLGILGSLRAGSINRSLLRAAIELAPPGITVEPYFGIGGLPIYNEDLDTEDPPVPVADLRERITEADAVLIVTPEYNYSIPGGLKNAIDWAARPYPYHSLLHKPVAAMGASPGHFGTLRAQLALRQVWLWTESLPVMKPQVHVFRAHERFDEHGNLTDEETAAMVVELLHALQRTAESVAGEILPAGG